MLGVPVDDNCSQEVQPRHAVVLPIGGAVADFTLAANSKRVFQRVMRFPFIQPDLRPTLHVGVEQPVDNEERAFDAPNLAQGKRKFMLARIRCEFLQELAGRHDASCHSGHRAQDIRPVLNDQAFPDLATIKSRSSFGAAVGLKRWRRLDGKSRIRGMKR